MFLLEEITVPWQPVVKMSLTQQEQEQKEIHWDEVIVVRFILSQDGSRTYYKQFFV